MRRSVFFIVDKRNDAGSNGGFAKAPYSHRPFDSAVREYFALRQAAVCERIRGKGPPLSCRREILKENKKNVEKRRKMKK